MKRALLLLVPLVLAAGIPADGQQSATAGVLEEARAAQSRAAARSAAPDEARTPRHVREYDWSRRLLLSQVEVPRFQTARLVIGGLNPICYSYAYEIQAQQVEIPSTTALSSLVGVEAAAAAPEGEASQPGGPGFLPSASAQAIRDELPARARIRRLTADEVRMRENLIGAAEALEEANALIAAANGRVRLIGDEAKATAGSACEKDLPFRNVYRAWEESYGRISGELASAERDLASARASISQARAYLGAAMRIEARLLGTPGYDRVPAEDAIAMGDVLAYAMTRFGEAVQVVDSAQREATERLMKTTRAVQQANVGMLEANAISTAYVDIRPGLLDGEYTVKVTATPHSRKPGEEPGEPDESSFAVPVSRSVRILMSAGFAFSPMQAPVHGRTDRPLPDSAGKTYSTFDVTDREELSYAPLIQANALLFQMGPVPVGLSFGAAAREVRSRKGIDFLLGITASVQDHLFITAGLYNARREYLRLGDVDEVRQGAVPATITEADAIGIERKSSFGFSFTFKN